MATFLSICCIVGIVAWIANLVIDATDCWMGR